MTDKDAIAFFIVLAIVIVEFFLSGTLARFYFTVGLPIYRRQVGCYPTATRLPSTLLIEATTRRDVHREMVFRDLGNSEYAFREALFGGFFRLHYTPMMHGLMRFDREHRQVLVIGFANWYPIAFLGLFALFVFETPSEAVFFVAFACGLVLFIYAIQARRFSQVASAAAALWSGATQNAFAVDESAIDRPIKAINTLWQVLVVCAIAVWLVGMALMVIGIFTEEWTCQEKGSDWKCVGGHECSEDANRRFDTHRRTMSCKRTDWPMIPLDKAIDFLHGWASRQPPER